MKLNAKFLTAVALAASVLTTAVVSPANAGVTVGGVCLGFGCPGDPIIGGKQDKEKWEKLPKIPSQADPSVRNTTAAQWGRNFDHGTLPYRHEAGSRAIRYGDDYVRTRTGVPYLPDPQASPFKVFQHVVK